jgi:hypothetical protein
VPKDGPPPTGFIIVFTINASGNMEAINKTEASAVAACTVDKIGNFHFSQPPFSPFSFSDGNKNYTIILENY